METTKGAAAAPRASACESMFVKWETPEDELAGTARLLEAFVHRHIDQANDLAIAVPNMTWAAMARRACASAGVAASIRARRAHVSAATKSRLALLEVIAHPDDEHLQEKWRASGHTDEERTALLERYGDARAQALIRLCDLGSCPELEHALLHTCGDEDAKTLFDVICAQLEHPTAPSGLEVVSIVELTHVSETYSQLFVIGCVEGLLPAEAADEDAVREAFLKAGDHATKRLYYSGFTKADADFARAAHIAFARTRRTQDGEVAMCRISPLFAKFGARRPSTLGGQALLRTYQLN